MRFKLSLIFIVILLCTSSVYALDTRSKEAKYIHKIQKKEAKENFERKKLGRNPSGFMTVEEYEALSGYKDKSSQIIEIPKVVKPSDMKYVPQPTYKIVRYNDPPGSPELNITKDFFKTRQHNGQGIVAPNYSILVYPVVYYYPNSASTAADLFVIPLEKNDTPLNKILRANVVKRLPAPILSTEKSISNDTAFRTLTPIDFSTDSTKLLVKEKIGSSQDGIWKTNAIVYDFETKTSYNLLELRDAIVYYWKENEALNLEEKRWDIFPLGFENNSSDRIVVTAFAYTQKGKSPVFLGVWSVDCHGEQSRLISFDSTSIDVAVNGFKVVQDGVVKPIILKNEEDAIKKGEKIDANLKRQADKEKLKLLKEEYKTTIKQMDAEFNSKQKELTKMRSINGTTSLNDIPQRYEESKTKHLLKNDIEKIQDLRTIEPPKAE